MLKSLNGKECPLLISLLFTFMSDLMGLSKFSTLFVSLDFPLFPAGVVTQYVSKCLWCSALNKLNHRANSYNSSRYR